MELSTEKSTLSTQAYYLYDLVNDTFGLVAELALQYLSNECSQNPLSTSLSLFALNSSSKSEWIDMKSPVKQSDKEHIATWVNIMSETNASDLTPEVVQTYSKRLACLMASGISIDSSAFIRFTRISKENIPAWQENITAQPCDDIYKMELMIAIHPLLVSPSTTRSGVPYLDSPDAGKSLSTGVHFLETIVLKTKNEDHSESYRFGLLNLIPHVILNGYSAVNFMDHAFQLIDMFTPPAMMNTVMLPALTMNELAERAKKLDMEISAVSTEMNSFSNAADWSRQVLEKYIQQQHHQSQSEKLNA